MNPLSAKVLEQRNQIVNLSERINFMRDGMTVRRYHQYHTTAVDTVGKHSCGVALFINLIDPQASKFLIMAALAHDLGEQVTGDIPSPTKKMLSPSARAELKHLESGILEEHSYGYKLSDTEEQLLKLADCFDGLAFCIEEANRGNRSLDRVARTYASYIPPLLDNVVRAPWLAKARDVFTVLKTALEKVNDNRK